ncbi:Pre-PUA domain-containing protein [Gonapodya prolifera JEL478]|uniref:60S ribosome subunit biogenesis protein NIP7 n=1 Tax=Gonapodya prolifera (strain JEL478) TaxID=1344416 RepID=A0A139AJW3_GONPJ|nr:Pre-PUA domain-containing protein [Gonapodya prolifera JEL478]|eukprot:KXS16998.1 Pre-PUA domain-containing protein [Gonapodya prolifera JEL478]
MRPLTDDETKALFEKLAKYIGWNIAMLIDRPDEQYCFRLGKDREYYVSESIMRKAVSISRENLVSLGTFFGKFTKSGQFRLHYEVWVTPGGEMPFLYRNNVLKAHLGRVTEDVPAHSGVIGFGLASHTTTAMRAPDPTGICVLHQADVGEYMRDEDGEGIG